MTLLLTFAGGGVAAPNPLAIEYILEVDWGNNGNFTGTYDDISDDLHESGGESFRGKSEPRPITGRASASTFTAKLWNTTGKYSRYNSSSPITGLILPGRPVRWRCVYNGTTYTAWKGFLDDIVLNNDRTATLKASGPFVKFTDAEIVIASTGSITTGGAIDAILDAVSWPSGDRAIDTGVVTLNTYFAQPAMALEGMREIEDTEMAAMMAETADGKVLFHARNRRTTASASTTSQGTFSDASGAALPYVGVVADSNPLAHIINHVKLQVFVQQLAAATQVWAHLFLPVNLATSGNAVFVAQVEEDEVVSSWTTPVVGTDVVGQYDDDRTDASANLLVTAGGSTSTSLEFTVVNLSSTRTISLTKVVARASRYTQVPAGTSEASDATSITKYGKRSLPGGLKPVWLPSLTAANTYRDAVIAAAKDPHPGLTLILNPRLGVSVGDHCFLRELSDRVQVTANSWENPYGMSAQPFFIESVAHQFSRDSHQTAFQLSAVS